MLRVILNGAKPEKVFISDSAALDLQGESDKKDAIYMAGAKDAAGFIECIKDAVAARNDAYSKAKGNPRPREYFRTLPPMLLLIDDTDYFAAALSGAGADREAKDTMTAFQDVGGSIIACAKASGFSGYGVIIDVIKSAQKGIVLDDPSDQRLLPLPYGYGRNIKGQIGIGYLIGGDMPVRFGIPSMA